jgi:peptidyl-prolyl cis-trans isomerase D
LIEGLNSEPVEVSNTRIVVVRVVEHAPSSIPSVDDVLAKVTQDFIDTRARDAVHTSGKALVERLNNGEDLETVLGSVDLKWETVSSATRDSPKLSRAILRAAFRADPGPAGEVIFTGVPIGTGDYGIVGVSNIVMPPIEQLNISDISELRRDVSATRTITSWLDFVALLKSDSKIESFPDRL